MATEAYGGAGVSARKMRIRKIEAWNLPNNKHAWAFYYFCKRKGDDVTAHTIGDALIVTIRYPHKLRLVK